jgi:AcrR family transcriptional regulator
LTTTDDQASGRTTIRSPRRRNAERSAATREKILAATVDCLYSLGYHQTTTVVVTERAGVSRGAMLHHFPSKADLMVATIEYVRRQMAAAHAEKLASITDPRERFRALVDVLWGQFSQPLGVARIELILASRSDPVCGPYFAKLTVELDQRHKDSIWPLANRLGFKDRKVVDAIVQLYAAAVRGLAMDALQPALRPGVHNAVNLLRDTMLMWADRYAEAERGAAERRV